MAKVITVANLKGGVGKTTTTLTIGIGFARRGYRVLLIDLDFQGSLSACLGKYECDEDEKTAKDLFEDVYAGREIVPENYIIHHFEGVDFIPADISFAITREKIVLLKGMHKEQMLSKALVKFHEMYDYIFIDSRPDIALVERNALACSDSVLLVVQAQPSSMKAVVQMYEFCCGIKQRFNNRLEIKGIIITMVERNNKNKEQIGLIREYFDGVVKVFNSMIPRAVRVEEASGVGSSIFELDHKNTVIEEAYNNLIEEVLKDE